jgi:hypothetical protein
MTFFPVAEKEITAKDVERGDLIQIRAIEWFHREDFQVWRQTIDGSPATWGILDREGDFCDVFMTFDFDSTTGFWEGSDSDSLPDDIYYAIGEVLKQQHRSLQHGVLWIKPV